MKLKIKTRRGIVSKVSGVAIAVAVSQVFVAASALAQQAAQQTWHLASGPLDRTLVEIAQATNVRLSYDAGLVQSLKSAPVEGSYSAEGAIRQALKGTGLDLVATSSGGLTIQKVAAKSAAPAAAAPVAASAAAASTAPVDTTLPLISVAATRDSGGTGFVAETSSTLTRSDVPLADTPKSVSVVNAAVIQSQNAQDLSDILRNVSGVVMQQGPFGTPTYSVRGFTGAGFGSTGITTDGAPAQASFASLTPTIALASVEVLKGPSAIVNGNSPPGGVINLVKKTPQAEPFHEVQVGYGSYGDMQLAFDSTGAITSDERLRYRFIVSGDRSGESSMGYDGKRNLYIAPTVQWKDRSTDITVGYERTDARQPFPQFTMGYEGGDIYRQYFTHPLGNPGDHFGVQSDNVFLNLEQKLGDYVTFVSKESYNKSRQVLQGWAPVTPIGADGTSLFMASNSLQYYYSWSLSNYLRAKVNFGKMRNTIIVGWDYSSTHYNQADSSSGGQMLQVNVFNPATPFPDLSNGTYIPSYGLGYKQNSYYVQEQMAYENLNLLASVRRDTFIETGNPGTTQSAYSPSLGILYRLTSDIAAYANYNRAYQPGTSPQYGGGLLPPQISEQVEVGTKFNFLDDKLSITTAAYRISYSNYNISDPVHQGYFLSAGGAVSRGFEVEMQGQVYPGVNLMATYTYNNFHQPSAVTTVVNLPKNTASLWATYNFQTPALQGLGVGLGLFFSGDQYVGTDNSYRLPSQLQTDIGVFYQKKGYGLNLSVKNIFNRKLYDSSTTPSFIPMGPKRTILLTGTYDF
ncbi:TonB-dependent siderophore receptor [Paraburkholderia unamae]|uniref:Iron complex outermembrane receptor protein n=1 Tax=Paraburkholderia unamae TaxID=219649 RepID=A0ABX5KJC3_9BURK|nr:TonB-dependent receptor [Paraburkholderia unamae]PVX81323.1 iron complex outermembrane receptor protein [Paraburkholderia unamae]